MKKGITLLLLVSMLLGSVTACGKSEVPEEANTATSEVVTENETSEGELYTVKLCMYSEAQEDDAVVQEEINKILKEKYNIQLELVPISPGEFDERMKLMSTSNEDYDLTFSATWVNTLKSNVAREAFLPLNDLLETEAGALLKESVPQYLFDATTINGNIYAVPVQPVAAAQTAYYVQKDLVEKYNLDVNSIVEPEDIEPFLEQIRDNEPDLIPMCEGESIMNLGIATPDGLETLVGIGDAITEGCAMPMDDDNLQVISTYESEVAKKAMLRLNDWYQRGFIRKDVATVTDNSAELTANKYAVLVRKCHSGGEAELLTKYNKEYVMIPLSSPVLFAGSLAVNMHAVNVNSKNPEAAVKMLGVLHSDAEVFDLLLYGIEGTHHTINADGRVEMIADSGYDRSSEGWALGDSSLATLLPGQDEKMWELQAESVDAAALSKMVGFSFNPENVQAEMAQIKTVASEYFRRWYYAEDFDAYWNEYHEKQVQAGLETVMTELQTQVDAWKAAK